MSVLSILASSLVASSYPTSERAGGAFLGALFLLLAFVYVRMILPHEH